MAAHPRRRFHLVAVSEDLSRTLAFSTPAGWLLPWLDDSGQAPLPAQVDSLLQRFASRGEMIHEAPLPPDSLPNPVQASCVAVVSEPTAGSGAIAVSNDRLHESHFLIAQQRNAWLDGIRRLARPSAPFDSHQQVRAILDWAAQHIASPDGLAPVMARHRCMRDEYVVRCETASRTSYLKAGPSRVADEAATTEVLWSLAPRQIPKTLTVDRERHLWLYEALAGEPLTGSRLTVDAASAATRALASLQKKARSSAALRDHLSNRSTTAVELFRRVNGVVGRACETFASQAECPIYSKWLERTDQMLSSCETVDRLGLPTTLVLTDFWPRNILATRHGIGFIDLEQSYWSYPLLSLGKFQYEIERVLRTGGTASGKALQAYIDEWADTVPPTTMGRALTVLPFVERLLNLLLMSHELDLHEQRLDAPLLSSYRVSQLSVGLERVLAGLEPPHLSTGTPHVATRG